MSYFNIIENFDVLFWVNSGCKSTLLSVGLCLVLNWVFIAFASGLCSTWWPICVLCTDVSVQFSKIFVGWLELNLYLYSLEFRPGIYIQFSWGHFPELLSIHNLCGSFPLPFWSFSQKAGILVTLLCCGARTSGKQVRHMPQMQN